MGAIKPWHLFILLFCFLVVGAILSMIAVAVMKRRK